MEKFKFFKDFLKALTNDGSGHSLRKWLAVGAFWVMAIVSVKFTDSTNLVVVLGVWATLISTLIITYTVGNVHEKKLDKE